MHGSRVAAALSTRLGTQSKVAEAVAAESQLRASANTVERRDALLAGVVAPTAAAVVAPPASAEEVPRTGAAKIQRVLVNVGSDEVLEKEVKFWTEACQMKLLSNLTDQNGNREISLGFIPEPQKGSFVLQVKQDPVVLTRAGPKLLNYDVMQPFVNALNFLQIGAKGKVVEIFKRVQDSGGSALIGDVDYLDAESPRGVGVRMIPRDTAPTFEFISFNVEVPAFDAVAKFYKRSVGMKELRLAEGGPPIQKLSVLLGSDLGGPNLLLCPVPDKRLKERAVDEFEGLLWLSPDVQGVAKAAEDAVALTEKEEREKEEEIKRERKQAKSVGQTGPSLKAFLEGTRARPSVQVVEKVARLDDGVGNTLFVTDEADFERKVAA